MKARRHHPAGVMPLELWDVLVEGRPLYDRSSEEIPGAVADVVRQLAAGSARRLRAHGRLPQLSIAHVVLAGGGALEETAEALRVLGFAASYADDPRWIAEPGGRALLATFCDASRGAVLDVGQTALKLSDRSGRVALARPLAQVPLELDARAPEMQPVFRRNALAFLARPLIRAQSLSGLVLGLPCEIADDLTVAGCSYPWPAGDAALIADLLNAAGLADTPCLVLNDAELAAVSVALTSPPAATLVLTLGLGLGGAFLSDERSLGEGRR